MSYSDNIREELALKRATRNEKLQRVFTRPPAQGALHEAQKEAVEARRLADAAAAKAKAAKK
jgi:hypothetical protein